MQSLTPVDACMCIKVSYPVAIMHANQYKRKMKENYISLSIWCTRKIAQYYTIGKSCAHHNSLKLAGKKLRIELWFDGWPISTIYMHRFIKHVLLTVLILHACLRVCVCMY